MDLTLGITAIPPPAFFARLDGGESFIKARQGNCMLRRSNAMLTFGLTQLLPA